MFFFLFPPEKPINHSHRLDDDTKHISIIDKWSNQVTWEDELLHYFEDVWWLLWKQWAHTSALNEEEMKYRLEKICEFYEDICNKILRSADYTLQEQYYYTLLMIYNIKIIDSNRTLATPNTLRNTISSINMIHSSQGRRWSAWTTHVKMNTKKIDSLTEFRNVFNHEVGWHILDLWVITDQYSSSLHPEYTEFWQPKFWLNDRSINFYKISRLDENTRRPNASYKDFVSGYSLHDTFEEIAEFSNAWINHHDLLLELAKNNEKIKLKYELFQEIFWNWYFDGDHKTLNEFDPNERVFDSTKPRKNM